MGRSQEFYALFLGVSESLVSLEEIGKRSYPTKAIMKEADLLAKFKEAEKAMPLLTNENYLESIRALKVVNGYVEIEYQKWRVDLEMEEKIMNSKLFKMGRKRVKCWENLQVSWKAFLFLKDYLPEVTDEGDKLFLNSTMLRNDLSLLDNGLRLNQIDFELAKLNAELAEIKKRL